MDEKLAVEALGALAQDTRLRVFRLLMEAGPEGLPAGEIARRLGTPGNTMSTHLAILTRAGLLHSKREGRVVAYAAAIPGVRNLIAFLVEQCCGGRPDDCASLLDAALPLGCCPSSAGAAGSAL